MSEQESLMKNGIKEETRIPFIKLTVVNGMLANYIQPCSKAHYDRV